MPIRTDSPIAGNYINPNDPDVVLNRLNLSLARSQRILNSWLPPRPPEEEPNEQDSDNDFKAMSEAGGIGSKTVDEEGEGILGGSLRQKKLSSNDRLLEHLLGKKAAEAKKKSRKDAGKSMAASKHVAPKPLVSRARGQTVGDSEDEEESGRAALFKSKRPKKVSKQGDEEGAQEVEQMGNGVDEEEVGAATVSQATERKHSNSEKSGAKRKSGSSGSYLDEILAQNAKKKRRKEQKHKTNA